MAIVPLGLFLLCMGIRVPNLADLYCAPKPQPRAVIEAAGKSVHVAVDKELTPVLEAAAPVPAVLPREFFTTRRSSEACEFTSLASPRIEARAPPLFRC